MKNKEIIRLFKSSMEAAAQILGVAAHQLKRDDYIRATVDNDIPRLNKVRLNELGGFSAAKDLYFPQPQKTKAELDEEMAQDIERRYVAYVDEYGITPSLKVISSWGYTQSQINKLFGGTRKLYHFLANRDEYKEVFTSLVNDTLFTQQAFEELKKKVKTKKKFIITTAVSGKEIEENCFKSLQTFEEVEDAMIIIQPCEDVASRNSIFDYELDRRLRDCGFAFKDLYLNNKFFLSSIKVSAKQTNPLTGLERLAQAKGSMALASPKQYLQFIANSNIKMPRALMTTGAITIADYSSELSMSKRTSYLAEFDHVMGALVVEIEDDRIFHFRQIQFDNDGSFYDLGWKYNPDGTVEEVEETTCVFGDTHVGSHCIEVDECLQEITEYVNCKEAIIHDIFDNRFNNHHDIHKPVLRGMLARAGKTKLMHEGEITAQWLDDWSERVDKLTIVKSNHDEALERYIDEGRWKDDAENLYDALDLVKARMDGKDPLKFLIKEKIGLANPERINWLDRDQDYMIYGIENGAHGDKGGNGSKGSLRSIERAYYKATVGHSHTAGIYREVYQVGTSTLMKLGYNSGPSSWTNTMCIQYPNGQRQLINIIKTKDGRVTWCLPELLREIRAA